MHHEAMQYVSNFATSEPVVVIELGSRDINGSPRGLFPNATYVGVDVEDGAGVDVVADGCEYVPKRKADVVVCCEVLEHLKQWRRLLNNAGRCCRKGGRVVVTAAGPGRTPHSAVDGGQVRPDEWYENIEPKALGAALKRAGFVDVEVAVRGADVQATGVKA